VNIVNWTNLQRSLIIFGTERPYWIPNSRNWKVFKLA